MRTTRYSLLPIAVFILTVLLAALAGCGGGMEQMNVEPAPMNANMRVNIGDAPADRVLALELSITSVALRKSSGELVTLLSTPAHVEMTHLAGTMEPLVIQVIPQGTYTECVVGVSAPKMMHMNMDMQMVEGPANLSTQSVTVPLAPAVTVGSSPMFLNLDFDVAASVAIDAAGNVTITPTFRATAASRGPEAQQGPENGALEDVTGHVTSVSPPTFSVAAEHMTQSLTFVTDASTVFQGVSGVGALDAHAMVEVDAVTRADGSLLATKVEVLSTPGGMMNDDMHAKGLVTTVTGAPVTELRLAMHNMMSPGSMMTPTTNTLAVTVTATTQFAADGDHVDLANLPFTPVFSRSTVALGQFIEAESDDAMGSMDGMGRITATRVELKRQSLTGAVSGYSGAGSTAIFNLALPPDSAFAAMTGQASIVVYRQPGTELRDITAVNNGDTVRVRGLLFYDAGTYRLVAGRITRP